MNPHADALGQALAELMGAVGIYLGKVQHTLNGDPERLERALGRAIATPAFEIYMKRTGGPT